jgi:hypothetical protein
MYELGRPLIPVAKLVWRKQLASLMKNMATLDAPDDAKVDIQLKELLTEFISRDGKDISAVLQSKPYTENGVSYFKFKDFWRFIIRSKSWPEKTYSKNKTIRLVENLFNGKTATKDITVKVKGKEEKKTVKLWTVEKIEVQEYTPKRLEKKAAPFE